MRRESWWPVREPGRPSYDDVQLGAVLTACGRCGRSFYMTHPGPVCIECLGVAGIGRKVSS